MRRFLGMRWWLGLAFAAVAALTAVAVVAVLNHRSEAAFRKHAEAFAVGDAVSAAVALKRDDTPAGVRAETAALAERLHLFIWAFGPDGRPLTPLDGQRVPWRDVPHGEQAKRAALAGNRYIRASKDGSVLVVGLTIHKGAASAVVAYAYRPMLSAELGLVRNEFFQAALIAFAVGAALGLVIATMTGHRLGRIAQTASAIGAGDFTTPVAVGFPDEVGTLALSIERMRDRLQELFLALEGDRDRLQRVFARLGDGILVVDRELRVEFSNERARELLGPEPNLAGLDPFGRALPGPLRVEDGDTVLEISAIPPPAGGDSAIVVVRDASQRERHERAQRQFAQNAAHELRTPLASIVTAVEMLQTGAKDDPEARDEFIDVIARESARLTRLARALLVLARAEAGEEPARLAEVPVAPLLDDVAAALRPRAGVRVEVDCPPSLAVVGDPDLLEQALTSVAANAVQNTSAGSVVLRGSGVNGSVVIEVADTGAGIAAGDREQIFERFYRAGTREGGFGLGLSIAREAVGTLGGTIAVESELEVGTTVRITLARARA